MNHAINHRFSKKYLLMLLAASALLIIVVNPYSLFFLNDDFDSLPVYGQGIFFHNRGTRLFVELGLFLDYQIYQRNAWGYIFSNLLIHISCCWLGLYWCKKMAASFGVKINSNFLLAGMLLFMWFAFHSETVFWTISRTASLGLLCFLGTWFCFFKAIKKKGWLAVAFVLMLCGLFSYETLVLVPAQLLLWHWLLPKNAAEKKDTKWRLFVSIAAIIVYLPVRRYITLEWIGSYEAKEVYAFNLFPLAKNYVSLLIRTLVPPMQNKVLGMAIGGFILLLIIWMSFIIVRNRKANNWWWFLLLNWLMSYTLFTSLGIDMGGYESERYLYVPSFFFCAWAIYSFSLLEMADLLKWLLAGSLITYHLVFFYMALIQFRKAGELAKKVIDTIHGKAFDLAPQKTVIENLPDKAFGIPVFRLGIKNGIQWLYPATDTSKLEIASKLLNADGRDPLFCKKKIDSATKILTIKFYWQQQN